MLSYYCLSPSGRDFLYIPYNLLAYTHSRTRNVIFRCEPDIIQRIGLAVNNRLISKERLEDRNWDVHEIYIPDEMVQNFRNLCFKTKKYKKILKKASEIFDFVEESYESFLEDSGKNGKTEIVQEGGYREIMPYDDEDFEDDWWLRGDSNPFNGLD